VGHLGFETYGGLDKGEVYRWCRESDGGLDGGIQVLMFD